MKKLSIINENIFDGIGKRSKGGVKRKEDEVEQVDLGLPSGTIWATCNLGASSPEECGDYYAWGETRPKYCYYWDNYKFGDRDNLTKYNKEDGKTILDLEDDAANAVLGGKWHIPTSEQINELFNNTTNEYSELNGVEGRLFKSKTNDNTLFFPYSGYKSGCYVNEDICQYWSSSTYINFNGAIIIDPVYYNKHKSDFEKNINTWCWRCYGICVRGVLDKK